MRRTLDPTRFNEIANHPEVRPWLGGSGALDLSAAIANPANFAFLCDFDNGGYIYAKLAQGLYEVHTLSVPWGRGRELLQARTASLRYMFLRTDATEIVTTVPDGNKGADVYAAHAGFRETYRRKACFDLMGERVGCSYRSLTYADWVLKDPANRREGEAFHRMIHAHVPDDHGADPVHDAWVGATVEACQYGNAQKAAVLFNRWAAHAGYQQVHLRSLNPVVADIRSSVIEITEAGVDVLLVREAQGAPPDIGKEEAGSCQRPSSASPRAPSEATQPAKPPARPKTRPTTA